MLILKNIMKRVLIKGKLDNYFIFPNNPNFNFEMDERFGKIFLGFSQSQDNKVVVKHLKLNRSNAHLSLFYHQENLLNINNANVSKCIELISENEHLFLIKEFVNGVSLKNFNRSYSFRSSNKIIEILLLYKNIAENISLIHSENVFITDLKPSNVIITDYSSFGANVKIKTAINDFGLAVSSHFTPVANLKIPYSLYYNSPEVLLGFYNLIGPYSDIYSLGFMMAETMMGYHPFKLKHPGMVVEHHMASPILFDKHIPKCVVDLINKSTYRVLLNKPSHKLSPIEKESILNESISNRYENIEKFIEDIEKCIIEISNQRRRFSFNIYEPSRINISSEIAVLFFDDICVFCLNSFNFIKKKDKKSVFRFASFDSNFFKNVFKNEELRTRNQSVILIYKNQIFTKSDAIIKIMLLLGGFGKLAIVLKIVPKFLRDFIYTLISKKRYKIWGKKTECYVPQIWEKHLFLK